MGSVITLIIQEIFIALYIHVLIYKFKPSYIDLFVPVVEIPILVLLHSWGQINLILIFLLMNAIYTYLLTFDVKATLVFSSIAYSAGVFADHFADIILKNFSGLPSYDVTIVITGSIVLVVMFFIMKKEKKINSGRVTEFKWWQVIVALLIVALLLALITFTEILKDQNFLNIVYNITILFLVFALALTVHFYHLNNLNREDKLKADQQQMELNDQYISELDRNYNELRKIRHEYQNTLISFEEYIRTNDLAGLKKYYHDSVNSQFIKLNHQKYQLEDLSKLDDKELKSIFFNKLYFAQSNGIEIFFESKNRISSLKTNTMDLVVALGIILDNAIEETIDQDNGQIQAGIMDETSEITFIVQNTTKSTDIPVWKMKQSGFSTKGAGRGLGLTNLSEIIDRNNGMTLETMRLGQYFLQKITIQRDVTN